MDRFTVELDAESDEYIEVSDLFRTTSRSLFSILSVHKVCNSNLERKFLANEREYMNRYGHVRTVKVWHGTKESNLNSILTNNLMVQLSGTSTGHRYGKGVSFSALVSYAAHYGQKGSPKRCMLLCDVLVSNIVEVPERKGLWMNLLGPEQPPLLPGHSSLRYDTTAKCKHTMDVIVKSEANTFRPTYVVFYH